MKAFSVKTPFLVTVLYWGFLAGLFFLVGPDLKAKIHAEKNDRRVTFAADWEDVEAFSGNEPKEVLMEKLRAIPVEHLVLSPASLLEDEALIRAQRFQVLWRLDDDIKPHRWLPRFRKGDVVFIAGKHVLEHPLLIKELPHLLQQGFLCAMEFHPDALLPLIAKQMPERVVKSHLLPTREIIFPKENLWKERLLRSIESRWVRLLIVRFSPGLSGAANLNFQTGVARELESRGYSIGSPALFPLWAAQKTAAPFFMKWRLLMILFISLVTPLMVVWIARSSSRGKPFVTFLGVNLITLFSGIVIHALGSLPEIVMGFELVRGVKLQLVVPLLMSGLILCSLKEVRVFLNQNVKVKHVALAGVAVGGLLGVYLMRSGNFPVIPVTDAERRLRDILEHLFIARPRFKEFLIGQPLLLLGLLRKGEGGNFIMDGRLLLWLGIIGQISILNTFMHFHSPFDLGVVRTLHGLWVGCFVALPFMPWRKSRP